MTRLLSHLSRAFRPEATTRREARALDAVFGPRSTSAEPPVRRWSLLGRALTVLGLAAALYGIASLTRGWLGAPPWWEHHAAYTFADFHALTVGRARYRQARIPWHPYTDFPAQARPARSWVGGSVTAAGLALASLAAWPRRRSVPAAVKG